MAARLIFAGYEILNLHLTQYVTLLFAIAG